MSDKAKLKTGAMLNPECQKCSKKDTCNNKTLCVYLIPNLIAKEVEKSLNNFDIKINN